MAEVKEISYRIFDELLDAVRVDFKSFQSVGDIDASECLKKAQQINYELGLKIHQPKETMLHIEHGRTKLPADYHQMLLTLVCHRHIHIQNAPWNGHVLLEEVVPATVPSVPTPVSTTCPCITATAVPNLGTDQVFGTLTDCNGNEFLLNLLPGITYSFCAKTFGINTKTADVQGTGIIIPTTNGFCYNTSNSSVPLNVPTVTPFLQYYPNPPLSTTFIRLWVTVTTAVSNPYGTTIVGSFQVFTPTGPVTVPYSIIYPAGVTTFNIFIDDFFNYNLSPTGAGNVVITSTGSLGTMTCSPPVPILPTPPCAICNVIHDSTCPEIVVNPYPLGCTRTLCNDEINIKIIEYGETEVRCYEEFDRLHIVPHIEASAFNRQDQFREYRHTGSVVGKHLETSIECGQVYLYYLGGMEDSDGNLLVLDHPVINQYYEYALKRLILENLYLNGEDLIQRLQYIVKMEDDYRQRALSIVNMPNYRNMIKTINIIRNNHNRQHYFPLSRYKGPFRLASNPIDSF